MHSSNKMTSVNVRRHERTECQCASRVLGKLASACVSSTDKTDESGLWTRCSWAKLSDAKRYKICAWKLFWLPLESRGSAIGEDLIRWDLSTWPLGAAEHASRVLCGLPAYSWPPLYRSAWDDLRLWSWSPQCTKSAIIVCFKRWRDFERRRV